jgi:hypothetical protein
MIATRNTPAQGDALATLRALVQLHSVDLLYADRYLHRAGVLLPQVCSREQYEELYRDQHELPDLRARLRRATEQADWTAVRTLAHAAAAASDRLARHAQTLSVAAAVYGTRQLHADPIALALSGVVAHPTSALLRGREMVLDQLLWLHDHDPEWRAFYAGRRSHFERLQLHQVGTAHPSLSDTHLRNRILAAIDRGDFNQVERLTQALATEHNGTSAHLCAPPVADGRIRALAAPIPHQAVDRAARMGCAVAELPALRSLNEYMCAESADVPPQPGSHSGISASAEKDDCSPTARDLGATLRENLDLLLGHPFISSGGMRYLPWFGPETVLVETFPETEPDAETPLLHTLGLNRRRGVPRLTVENALLTYGSRVVADLALDPQEFTLACIPFDVYLRLAPGHGWGRREMWTHFDGYEVTRDLHLWGLVGGHASYGGADDLSIVARDYESERVTLRLAVVRRERFLVRQAPAAGSAGKLPHAFRSPARPRH